MKKVEQFIKEYKKTRDKKTLDKIFDLLRPTIVSKAKFIFYKKFYPLSLYNKCYQCRICKYQKTEKCKNCDKCNCIRGSFNLKKSHLCEYQDVENNLWVDLLRMIETYDSIRSWNSYFYTSLWHWQPTFLTQNFIKSLLNSSLTTTQHLAEKENINKELEIFGESEDAKKLCKQIEEILSKQEKQIFSILLSKNRLTEEEIAKKIGKSQQYVSKKIIAIKNKVKKFVVK